MKFAVTLSACLTLLHFSEGTLSDYEKEFISIPDSNNAQENLKYITSKPHVAGTNGDLEMATYVYNQLIDAGLPNVSFWNLTVGLNYPIDHPQLSMVDINNNDNVIFQASLSEDILSEDSTSDTIWRNMTFNGYAPSGDVQASVVYANYGRPEDFDYLESQDIDVTNKIVIVRYGECFRGLKAMNAEARGAIGTIIYSDPEDDGYGAGDVYPDGPWRPSSSVQRGSAQFNSLCGGDPYRADPRYKALNNGDDGETSTTQDVCSYDVSELIPSHPVLPISYGDAQPILAMLGGLNAPDSFIGGIDNLTYTLGPSEGIEMHLKTSHEDVVTPIWNIVATIEGTLDAEDDLPILMGNHRDAWVYGAADPNSGTAALIEVARGFGTLLANGWKPRRTIQLLSWSGEEYGLLGSTGYGELNADWLSRAAIYLNTDVTTSGDALYVYASPALGTLWEGVLTDLNGEINPNPNQGNEKDVKDEKLNNEINTFLGVNVQNGPIGDFYDCNSNKFMKGSTSDDIKTLGSGSDYTVFLDRLGIASLDFLFSPNLANAAAQYGVYHSIYDSFDWMNEWGGDGTQGTCFDYIVAASKVWGILAMRLATDQFVPFDHEDTAKALGGYLKQLESEAMPGLDLSNLTHATTYFARASQKMVKDIATCPGDYDSIVNLNNRLSLTERKFLSDEGLPSRPWFKHVLQAPGLYLGYAGESYPGIQQAIDDGNLELAQEQVNEAALRVNNAATFLGDF
jgi:N-acetylated-alpha-linked acidic dipeptidase